jgi:hypothetical protein
MSPVVIRVGIPGILLESRGVARDQRRGRLGVVFEVCGQLAEIDLERGQRERRGAVRVLP